MLLLLDNYDSFTYNLYDYLLSLGAQVHIARNDAISLATIQEMRPSGIVISPGPGRPADAGITMDLIAQCYRQVPMLGICLGHQAIGEWFGAKLVKSTYPMHGKTSLVRHQGDAIFQNVPATFEAMRYHSLELENIASTELLAIAETAEGTLMAIKHQQCPVYGIQFHPESILTPFGKQILGNWLNMVMHSKPIA
ncbi:MAG: aminodeoxychorismate/anthranilate synthase component II [Chitinophagales bacterium]|nr:aminodeoxychorismate/anthranilate synthase component II [Chitinophagales bacterium]